MDISRIRALRGPNLWTRQTAIEAIVHCQPEERSLSALPGFEAALRERFPQLGRWPRPAAELSLANVLKLIALGLQAQAGCPVSFSRCTETVEPGTYQVVVEYTEEAVGREAFKAAGQLIAVARGQGDETFDVEAVIARLREIDEDVRLGPSTGCIVNAAVARGIPFRRLTQGSLVQFGWGARQRRIWAAEVGSTSAVSENIAQDKDLTKNLLRAAGVPVPLGRPVDSAEEAWAVAQYIGLPVVVKPRDGNQGKGVTVNIVSRDHLELAVRVASEYGQPMVEKYLPGSDYRLLVVGDRMVAAARRDPPQVTGDGVSTVSQLVNIVNADPQRGDGHGTSLTRMRIDEIALARLQIQGHTPDTVPAKGERVVLRNNANLSTGGTATDVTDDVHPEVAARAVAAARMVGLDVCGVDVVCETVLTPLEEQSGGIVEVNAAPGLRMHLSPSYGKGRAVGEAIIDHLFAPSQNGRIPVVAVTGTNGKTTTARLIAHLLHTQGHRGGMTNSNGVNVNGRQTDSGDCAGPRSARNVLMHPDVDAAVFETARGGVLREGLGFDRCQVAVVTNIGSGDHLGLNYITTVEDIAVLKRVVIQNVAPNGYGVLNAADPHCIRMAEVCTGQVIFFASDAQNPVLATHRAQGHRAVWVEGAHIVATQGGRRHEVALADIPITMGGRIGFQVENAMAALAAAWALGMPWARIRKGLASFQSDAASVPGRFNLMTLRGATVIADYGHNPDAMRALVAAAEAMPAQRRIVVISGAGDRRDEDIRDQTRILGAAFDEVILYEDACQRGRTEGEVTGLLRQGLQGATRTTRIDTIQGEFVAIDTALARLQPGDLCLVLIDQVEEALRYLRERCDPASSASSATA
jgi:cyanophycin synthetase